MPRKANTNKKSKSTVEAKPEPTPVEPTPVDDSLIESFKTEFNDLSGIVKDTISTLRNLQSRMTALDKRITKEVKTLEKKKHKKHRATGTNGFSKPGNISDELREFLQLNKDELIARTEVTKKITEYCNTHNLQNESDKRIIIPNAQLRKLLRINKSDELTYFNLQKYMKVHFPNKDGVFIHA